MDLQDDSVPSPAVPARVPSDDYQPLSYADLQATLEGEWDWLWRGFLVPGNVTLLSSQWKSGKTTLVAALLARMKTGGLLAGLPVRPGRALVISEETRRMWCDRGKVLDLAGHVDWICQPFRGRPRMEQWLKLLDRVDRHHAEKGVDLLVIDSLAKLAPMRNENDAVEMLKALSPLEKLTAQGIAPLICHHPRKGRLVPGQAARGSGALPAFVDIVIEMLMVSGQRVDRRRRLRSFSRYSATPPTWVIEWTADGKDYRGLGASAEPDFAQGWPVLQAILLDSEGPMTRRDILRRWPESAVRPAKLTLWKWLSRVVEEGQVLQDGRGDRKEPFRYSLPGMIEKWQAKFNASFLKDLKAR